MDGAKKKQQGKKATSMNHQHPGFVFFGGPIGLTPRFFGGFRSKLFGLPPRLGQRHLQQHRSVSVHSPGLPWDQQVDGLC